MTEKPEKTENPKPAVDYRLQDRITLKKIGVFEPGSQETWCFTADIYFDGVKVATTENAGYGGCDNQHITNQAQWDLMQKYIATFDCINPAGGDGAYSFMPDIETVTCDLINRYLTLKDIKKRLKNRMLTYENGQILQTKTCRAAQRDYWVECARADGVTVLNGMCDAALLAVWRRAGL